jgi:hypothetical protein
MQNPEDMPLRAHAAWASLRVSLREHFAKQSHCRNPIDSSHSAVLFTPIPVLV